MNTKWTKLNFWDVYASKDIAEYCHGRYTVLFYALDVQQLGILPFFEARITGSTKTLAGKEYVTVMMELFGSSDPMVIIESDSELKAMWDEVVREYEASVK